jgi:predicted nucleic acid-binding protein
MAVKVVDASVVAALAFGEPEAGEAAGLLSDSELVAPTLLRYELSNAAWKKSKRHPAKAPLIAAGLRLAGELEIEYVDVDHAAVLDLALERNVTAYDASYLWLAWTLKAPLATFDAKVKRALPRSR